MGNKKPSEDWKHCPCCDYERPVSEFYKDKTRNPPLTSYCRDCKREAREPWMRDYRKAHPERAYLAALKADAKRGRQYAIRKLRVKL